MLMRTACGTACAVASRNRYLFSLLIRETCKNKVGNSSNYSERSWLSVESVEYYSTQNRHITPKTLTKRRVIVLSERRGRWSITPPETDTLPLKHYQKGVS